VALVGSEGVPSSVFVKLPPFSPDRRAFVDQQGMGVAEARFYAEVAESVPVRVPSPWFAATDSDGRYVMVLEDLLALGARYPTPDDAHIEAIATSVIDNLAALHAAFWACERFAPGGDLAWLEARGRGYGAAGGFVQFAAEQVGADMPDVFHRMVEVYVVNDTAVAGMLAAGERTLVHGDAHIGNMFAFGDDVGFLDWAVSSFAPGMRDVAYFLGSSVSTQYRRGAERDLVRRYCDGLRSRGVELDFDSAWEQYRLQMVTSWIAAVVTAAFGSELQPIEIGLAATARANAAIADLEVPELLARQLGG
jgi:hypothetical protein